MDSRNAQVLEAEQIDNRITNSYGASILQTLHSECKVGRDNMVLNV